MPDRGVAPVGQILCWLSATLTALLVVAGGPALAQRPITESGVWLDPTAPQPRGSVAGVVQVSGIAQLTEGITRIGVYVSDAGRPAPAAPAVEVAPALPAVGEVAFAMGWDTRGLAGRLVDVRVVASGALRSVHVVLPSVRVVAGPALAPPAAPDLPPGMQRRAERTGTSVPGRGPLPGVYLGGFGTLPYAGPTLRESPHQAAPLDVRRAAAPAGPPSSGSWPAVAGGLLLIVVSAHVHRVLRLQPGSEGPS